MSKSEKKPKMGNNNSDRACAILRSVASAFPLVGGILSEIISVSIPNQRIDRIEIFLLLLSEEINKKISVEDIQNKILENENTDLFEDGLYQAYRATSKERIKYISHCVAHGIASDTLQKQRKRRILRILPYVDDEEIILLQAYQNHTGEIFESLRPDVAYIGCDKDTADNHFLYEAGIENLKYLGLIETYYPFAKKGEVLTFNAFKQISHRESKRITPLGKMFLESINLQ